MAVVLATTNQGKLSELRAVLARLSIEVVPQSDYTRDRVEETGLTFLENALLKARHAAQHAGLPAIADDSGLEVDALAGEPGIRSARYAGPNASDAENLAKLLSAMDGIEPAQRTARYRCAIVYLRHALDPAPIVCQSAWEGRIGVDVRGNGGFGYDPIFEIPALGLTAAELDSDSKNALSHRGQAVRELAKHLADESVTR
jgi:XTP/dITP diphosphohydrolase